MGFLRALLGLVGRRGVGQILPAEPARDPLPSLVLSLAGHPHGVRAHVGDEADGPLVAELDAFVELLRQHHGLASREVELAARLLLKSRGDEGGGGIAAALPARDALHLPGRPVQIRHHRERRRFGGKARLLALDLAQGGHELRRVLSLELGVERPVLRGHEGEDLALALGEKPHGHGLHATRGQAAPDLFPEEWGELVAHEPVEDTPGLLRVHLLGVDLAGMEEGRLDRALRDLVEHDPESLGLRHPQLFREMPPDGLAFAIRVRRNVQRVGLLRRLLELVEDLLLGG